MYASVEGFKFHRVAMPSLRSQKLTQEAREATIDAIGNIFEPLTEMMFDAGLTVQNVSKIYRSIAVKSAAQRLERDGHRVSAARLSIITGLSRSQIAEILTKSLLHKKARHEMSLNSAQKVLTAWHETAEFTNSRGEPSPLPLFGAKRSFESLVQLASPGTPVRAMIDQLRAIKSVKIRSDQRVVVLHPIAIGGGNSAASVRQVGRTAAELLRALVENLTRSDPLFQSTALAEISSAKPLAVIRREIRSKSSNFITSTNRLLRTRSKAFAKISDKAECSNILAGVIVQYFERTKEPRFLVRTKVRRKNFRRTSNKNIRSEKKEDG